jgi:hypothetical protein
VDEALGEDEDVAPGQHFGEERERIWSNYGCLTWLTIGSVFI